MTNETPENLPQLPTVDSTPTGDMFAKLLAAVENPDIDADKAEKLLQMNVQMMDRQAVMDFNAAKARATLNMPVISRDNAVRNHKTGQVQSRYATFEAIDKIVRPIAAAEGLAYTFDVQQTQGGQVGVTCVVSHIGGHVERVGPMPLAVDTTGAKNATQGAGSAVSYGKRYTLCAAFNIITEGQDNDGAGKTEMPALPGFEDLEHRARQHALEGSEAYKRFFDDLTNAQRGHLMDTGAHANCKRAAEEAGK